MRSLTDELKKLQSGDSDHGVKEGIWCLAWVRMCPFYQGLWRWGPARYPGSPWPSLSPSPWHLWMGGQLRLSVCIWDLVSA